MASIESKNIHLAIIFALVGSFFNTLMSLAVKLIGSGQPTATVVFARFFIGLLVIMPWALTDKNIFVVHNKIQLLFRCITTLLTIVCVFYSLKFLPMTNVLLLYNTLPLFMPILTLILFGIKTPSRLWFGIFLGFVGVAFVLQPSSNHFNWASIIALISGLLAALATLQIRLLTETNTTKQIVFYLFLLCTIISAFFVPFSFQMFDPYQLLLLVLVGVFGAGYQLFLSFALENAIARIVTPIYFSSIVFAAILDWLFFNQIPNEMALIGMILIILCGVLIILLSPSKMNPKAISS